MNTDRLFVVDAIHFLEKAAFNDGIYKTSGFGGYPGIWCEYQHGVTEEPEGIDDERLHRK